VTVLEEMREELPGVVSLAFRAVGRVRPMSCLFGGGEKPRMLLHEDDDDYERLFVLHGMLARKARADGSALVLPAVTGDGATVNFYVAGELSETMLMRVAAGELRAVDGCNGGD
jgi:hypothetical protein